MNIIEKIERKPIDHYFLELAFKVAERSTCRRRHIGAIIVRDKHILTTGYNGACSGVKDCLELGCLKDELKIASGQGQEICRAVHAEQNAIIQAALHGVSTEGATIYCTHSPCGWCAKTIVNAKIKRCVCSIIYSEEIFKDLFKEAGIEFVQIKQEDLNL
ncbi:MAG TPA: dCMP deaminase family protein [Rickettsiales bacterium]|nr:dCMP deaminase family protein [Rickettsiales bacterium]